MKVCQCGHSAELHDDRTGKCLECERIAAQIHSRDLQTNFAVCQKYIPVKDFHKNSRSGVHRTEGGISRASARIHKIRNDLNNVSLLNDIRRRLEALEKRVDILEADYFAKGGTAEDISGDLNDMKRRKESAK